MTTSYRDPVTSEKGKDKTSPWKAATLALSVCTVVLAFMYANKETTPHSMAPMTNTMSGSHYDHGFINMMIPHHQQAIDEANAALKEARHPELKQLARNIITSQQSEIDQMKQWRKEWYGE
ncbi:MAG: DUF305 domain-containing protein [Candidatus Obscuribacterales bacterium]|nr:DUF305 domain-containing protein [Candidatus Obscuribacterales bacterium]